MISYTDAELDFVSDTITIGVNRAAAALGELAGRQVFLSVPTLAIITAIDLVSELCATTDAVCGLFKRISQPVESYAVLIVPKSDCDLLVRHMVPGYLEGGDPAQNSADALLEIGNILIGACFGAIADIFGVAFDLDQPVVPVEHPSEFFLASIMVDDRCDYILDIRIDMAISGTPAGLTWEFLLPDTTFAFLKQHMPPGRIV